MFPERNNCCIILPTARVTPCLVRGWVALVWLAEEHGGLSCLAKKSRNFSRQSAKISQSGLRRSTPSVSGLRLPAPVPLLVRPLGGKGEGRHETGGAVANRNQTTAHDTPWMEALAFPKGYRGPKGSRHCPLHTSSHPVLGGPNLYFPVNQDSSTIYFLHGHNVAVKVSTNRVSPEPLPVGGERVGRQRIYCDERAVRFGHYLRPSKPRHGLDRNF